MKLLNRLSKLPIEYYIVIFLFLVILWMSITQNKSFSIFESDPKTLNMYTYENFESGFPETTHSAANSDGSQPPAEESSEGVLGISKKEELSGSPLVEKPMFDPVSKLSSNPDCVGKSNGYSNSKGGLCFDEETSKYFHSRGQV
jgi:hypothetical protein